MSASRFLHGTPAAQVTRTNDNSAPPGMQGQDKGTAAHASKSLWRILCDPSAPQTVLTRDSAPQQAAAANAAHATAEESFPDSQLVEDSKTQSRQADNAETTEDGSSMSQIVANPGMMLSGEQKAVLQAVLRGKQNIFFTGAAGTGKSVLLRCIISQLRSTYRRDDIAVTALTGIAACNIGGTTLHRFAGIGLGQDSAENYIRQIQRNQRTLRRWQSVKVLLVDEVSMLCSDLLEKLEAIARGVRGNNIKFGGIQLVFTGDLFQLPPITSRYGPDAGVQQRYCFESALWPNLIDRTVNLTRVFRQADSEFADMLNDLRVGVVKPETAEKFRRLVRPPRMPKGIVPTKLFPRRVDVNAANQKALQGLAGTTYEYDCFDDVSAEAQREKVDLNIASLAEQRVHLKVGAQVMMIKNIDDTIVNGSIGKIVAFMSAEDMGIKERRRAPRDEAYYQGSDENGYIGDDLYDDPAYGADILGAYGNSEAANRKRKLAERLSMQQTKSTVVWPVVRFNTREGTIRYMMVRPETWSITDSHENVIASRTQIPLLLAWALSIHKAQGQTLPYVSVNLQRIFEKGQAYVAISRATCLDGLQIHRFSERAVMVDSRVLKFYEGLEKVNDEEIAEAESFFAAVAKPPQRQTRAQRESSDPDYQDPAYDRELEHRTSVDRQPKQEPGIEDLTVPEGLPSQDVWHLQSDASEPMFSSDDYASFGSIVHTDNLFDGQQAKRARTTMHEPLQN